MSKGLILAYTWLLASGWWVSDHMHWVMENELTAIAGGTIAGFIGLGIRILFDGWADGE